MFILCADKKMGNGKRKDDWEAKGNDRLLHRALVSEGSANREYDNASCASLEVFAKARHLRHNSW